jgi:hypothetical protein
LHPKRARTPAARDQDSDKGDDAGQAVTSIHKKAVRESALS